MKTSTIEETAPESASRVMPALAHPREESAADEEWFEPPPPQKEPWTENDRLQLVIDKMRAGWTTGKIKQELRRVHGQQSHSEMMYFLKLAKEHLSKDVESDSTMATALDLYARWTELLNIANAQVRSRERLHKSLGIPSPQEMLKLERDFGIAAPTSREAVILATGVLRGIVDLVQPVQGKAS